MNRYLIDGIGEWGGGFAQTVIPHDQKQGERAVNRFFARIDSPVLVDPQIDWNGLPINDIYPKRLGDLFAGQTISVVGRYADSIQGSVFVNGRIGARPVRFEVHLQLPAQETQNQALGCLWARQKIHELTGTLGSAEPERKEAIISEVTDLAVKYRLASDYTSFVAVDQSRIIGNGKPLKVLQPVEIPQDYLLPQP